VRSQSTGTAVFLDTTIQIARVVHSEGTKQRIKETIKQYTLRASSPVVKQEYKRRLLEEVQWCLNQLNDPRRPKTFEELFRHVTDFVPPQQDRKKKICTQICHTVLAGAPRGDLTERARRHFRTLLRTGMSLFERGVGHVGAGSGCACADHPVIEDKAYKRYDFGPVECGECRDRCNVAEFLADQSALVSTIVKGLASLPKSKKAKADGKLTELGQIESFLKRLTEGGEDPCGMNPCLTVGDLLIALESERIPDFYTMNWSEFQFLCRWMKQNLVLRRVYPEHEDITYHKDADKWSDPR
jgi:hypothetical protein